jgi:hypothetical protein
MDSGTDATDEKGDAFEVLLTVKVMNIASAFLVHVLVSVLSVQSVVHSVCSI